MSAPVDMSPEAIARRIAQVGDLSRLCASLSAAGTQLGASPISPRFHADRFAEQRDRERLASELRGLLRRRLIDAAEPELELSRIVHELAGLGHHVAVTDDDGDVRVLADAERRLALVVHWRSGVGTREVDRLELRCDRP